MSSYCLLAENAYVKMVSNVGVLKARAHGLGLSARRRGCMWGRGLHLPVSGLREKNQQHRRDSACGLEASLGAGSGAEGPANCVPSKGQEPGTRPLSPGERARLHGRCSSHPSGPVQAWKGARGLCRTN